jgi:hypothetical protein
MIHDRTALHLSCEYSAPLMGPQSHRARAPRSPICR